MNPQLQALEERIAHLTRAVDDLSAVVHDQAQRLERTERALRGLIDRAAEQDGDAPPANVRPPHW